MMTGTLIVSGFRASRHTHCPALSPSRSLSSLVRGWHASHISCLQLHRYPKMVEAAQRRIHQESADKGQSSSARAGEHEPPNSHSHAHGIFGGHSHSHDHDHDHDHGGGLIETLQTGGARPLSSL
jgi:hypothetical protein